MKSLTTGVFVLLLFGCPSDQVRPDWLPESDSPYLIYVIDESSCFNCVEELKPFTEIMATHNDLLTQQLVVVSADASDRQGFREMLQLPVQITSNANTLELMGMKPGTPMMLLLQEQRVLYARPITFVGHSMQALQHEILALRHEFLP